MPESLAVRLWRRIGPRGPDDCWEWIGLRRGGYGRLRHNRKWVAAHRLVWESVNGPIPAGMEVCHKCDNPPCCNPSHLFLATHRENMRDSSRKGRMHLGERSGAAKLTSSQVREIRATYRKGVAGFGRRLLAKKFGVSTTTIYRILEEQYWRDVT